MSTTPSEILDTAKRLSNFQNMTEADVRAVVSRAYYAALHCVDITFPGSDTSHQSNSHEAIIQRAADHGRSLNPGRTSASQVAREMFRFKVMRKKADYKINIDMDQDKAGIAITLCTSIIELCSTIQ